MSGDPPPEGWEPYADGTSGHQGDTSRDAEPDRRGKMMQTLEAVARSGSEGVTWYDVSELKGWYQGSCGSNLSNLHRSGIICRLKERRINRGVYVLPEHVNGRETVPFNGKHGAYAAEGLDFDQQADLLDDLCAEILAPDSVITTVEEVVELARKWARQLRRERRDGAA